MSDFALVIEGSPYIFVTGTVSPTSYTDSVPAGATVLPGSLGRPEATLTERLRPLEGTCEVSGVELIIHDTQGQLTDQFTRETSSSALTFLTASVSSAAVTATVDSAAALGALPRDVWVGNECWSVTSIAAGNTVNITRGRYGTPSEAIEVSVERAELPELFSHPCWMKGRRAKLYRLQDTTATLRWLGYVSTGPALAANGASFTLSCISAWEQEGRATFAPAQAAATLSGYDAQAILFTVRKDNGENVGSSRLPDSKAWVYPTLGAALNSSLAALRTALLASGATNFTQSVSASGHSTVVVVGYRGLTLGTSTLRVGDTEHTAQSVLNGTYVEHVWTLDAADGGALVRAGFALGALNERATVVSPHVGLRPTGWGAYAGSRPNTVITPVLVGDIDEGIFLELDGTGMVTSGVVPSDTTFTRLGGGAGGVTTFHGAAKIVSRDPTVAPLSETTTATSRLGLPVAQALPLRHEIRVESDHWLEGIRTIVEDTSYATAGSDSRNWAWPGYDATVRRSRDSMGAVEYRTGGSTTVSEFVTGEAALRGCCVTVDKHGRLGVTDLKAPAPTDPVTATITTGDILVGEVPGFAPSPDGSVTDIVFETPLRTLTLRDAVATGRYRTQRAITVRSQSTRQDARVVSDPVGYALISCGKLLGKWRDELWVHTIPVSASRFEGATALGSVVSFESFSAPDRAGGRGFTGINARRGVVIGRSTELTGDTLTLEVLEMALVHGFAPSARVASISGAVLTLATTYAGVAIDYAGSALSGYSKTSNDRGAGWFVAGDKVQLVLRDTATHTVESYTVASVASGSVTLTASVNTAPTDWPAIVAAGGFVDVVFDSWGTAVASQRVFAAVSSKTTHLIAATSPAKRWAP